jgi:hypothetical protein
LEKVTPELTKLWGKGRGWNVVCAMCDSALWSGKQGRSDWDMGCVGYRVRAELGKVGQPHF